MSFLGLEERFNETVNKLYAGSKTKFENGKPSSGRNDDPLIVRKPGDGYWTSVEGRGAPVVSAALDVKRLTLFTLSKRGIAFLAKQQLLQTGNTFESTRIINPAFVLANGIPFVHAKRALEVPITVRGIGRQLLGNGFLARKIFGSGAQKNDSASLRKIGQLQEETYNKAINRKDLNGLLKKIPVIGQTASAVRAKRSVGELGDGYTNSRPELAVGRYIITKLLRENETTQDKYKTGYIPRYGYKISSYDTYLSVTQGKTKWAHGFIKRRNVGPTAFSWRNGDTFSAVETATDVRGLRQRYSLSRLFTYDTGVTVNNTVLLSQVTYKVNQVAWYRDVAKEIATAAPGAGALGEVTIIPYIKYFAGGEGSIIRQEIPQTGGNFSLNARDRALTQVETDEKGKPVFVRKKISYIKDPSNYYVSRSTADVQEPYKYINNNRITATGGWADPVSVGFAMGKDDPIRFRGFITDLNENVVPQYTPYQYIGRIEKFINYTGVQRELSFKLAVLAFSKEELEGVWRRINYLTGLAFPYGFTNGILQPNIVRLSIGEVYQDQPGYISSLNKNFTDLTETWDIDSQVPIGATMDIKFTIIENATKIARSPFHSILETADGFDKNIQVPGVAKNSSETNTDTSTTTQQTVVVEGRG